MTASFFTLKEAARVGLPVGRYVARIDDVEAGTSGTQNPKMTFKATVVMPSEDGQIKAGAKAVWSYTMQTQYLGIIATDLMRAKLDPDAKLPADAKELANVLLPLMRGQTYLISVAAQKGSPDRTNTSIIEPFSGAGVVAGPPTQAAPPPPLAAPRPQEAMQTSFLQPKSVTTPAAPNPLHAPTPGSANAELLAMLDAAKAQAAPPVELPGLDATIIQAVMAGTPIDLNDRQKSELEQLGMKAQPTAHTAAVESTNALTAFGGV